MAATEDQNSSVTRVLALTNAARQDAGVGLLTLSPALSDAAQSYSQTLALGDCFAHTCGLVPDFSARVQRAGYTVGPNLGENIAGGYATPEDVVAGWMASPEHRANILSPEFTDMGIGVATGKGQYGMYWTEDFGSQR